MIHALVAVAQKGDGGVRQFGILGDLVEELREAFGQLLRLVDLGFLLETLDLAANGADELLHDGQVRLDRAAAGLKHLQQFARLVDLLVLHAGGHGGDDQIALRLPHLFEGRPGVGGRFLHLLGDRLDLRVKRLGHLAELAGLDDFGGPPGERAVILHPHLVNEVGLLLIVERRDLVGGDEGRLHRGFAFHVVGSHEIQLGEHRSGQNVEGRLARFDPGGRFRQGLELAEGLHPLGRPAGDVLLQFLPVGLRVPRGRVDQVEHGDRLGPAGLVDVRVTVRDPAQGGPGALVVLLLVQVEGERLADAVGRRFVRPGFVGELGQRLDAGQVRLHRLVGLVDRFLQFPQGRVVRVDAELGGQGALGHLDVVAGEPVTKHRRLDVAVGLAQEQGQQQLGVQHVPGRIFRRGHRQAAFQVADRQVDALGFGELLRPLRVRGLGGFLRHFLRLQGRFLALGRGALRLLGIFLAGLLGLFLHLKDAGLLHLGGEVPLLESADGADRRLLAGAGGVEQGHHVAKPEDRGAVGKFVVGLGEFGVDLVGRLQQGPRLAGHAAGPAGLRIDLDAWPGPVLLCQTEVQVASPQALPAVAIVGVLSQPVIGGEFHPLLLGDRVLGVGPVDVLDDEELSLPDGVGRLPVGAVGLNEGLHRLARLHRVDDFVFALRLPHKREVPRAFRGEFVGEAGEGLLRLLHFGALKCGLALANEGLGLLVGQDGRVEAGLQQGAVQVDGHRVLRIHRFQTGLDRGDRPLIPADRLVELGTHLGKLDRTGFLGFHPPALGQHALGVDGDQPGDFHVRLGGLRVGGVGFDEGVELALGLVDQGDALAVLGFAHGLFEAGAGDLQRDRDDLIRRQRAGLGL